MNQTNIESFKSDEVIAAEIRHSLTVIATRMRLAAEERGLQFGIQLGAFPKYELTKFEVLKQLKVDP